MTSTTTHAIVCYSASARYCFALSELRTWYSAQQTGALVHSFRSEITKVRSKRRHVTRSSARKPGPVMSGRSQTSPVPTTDLGSTVIFPEYASKKTLRLLPLGGPSSVAQDAVLRDDVFGRLALQPQTTMSKPGIIFASLAWDKCICLRAG